MKKELMLVLGVILLVGLVGVGSARNNMPFDSSQLRTYLIYKDVNFYLEYDMSKDIAPAFYLTPEDLEIIEEGGTIPPYKNNKFGDSKKHSLYL